MKQRIPGSRKKERTHLDFNAAESPLSVSEQPTNVGRPLLFFLKVVFSFFPHVTIF